MIVMWENDNFAVVYPRIDSTSFVTLAREESTGKVVSKKQTVDGTIEIDGKKFIASAGHLLYKPQKDTIMGVMDILKPKKYRVIVSKNRVRYEVGDHVLDVAPRSVKFNGIRINSPEDIHQFMAPLDSPEVDLLLLPHRVYRTDSRLQLYPAVSMFTLPREYDFRSVEHRAMVYRIETPDGKRFVPVKPAFLALTNHFNVDYAIKNALSEGRFVEFDRILPGFTAKTGNGIFSYTGPENWSAFVRGLYFERRGNEWFLRAPDHRGFAEHVWIARDGEYYVEPKLITGQQPLYVRFFDGKARLYGVVTPEGMFVIDVPEERVYKEGPISIFEEGVDVVGTFFVFPFTVKFEKSAAKVHNSAYLSIILDDLKLSSVDIRKFSFKQGEAIFRANGLSAAKKELIMNYGPSI